ncbi:hypothetical protein PENNAL_c0004G07410 [Penicillium nalgiovense]|uniref:Uncharacterized protein n=1 Tax=Penicillium nalgiovense TaxID=60175 RepID=A0A1V6Z4J4_PENNA|nr:hypothetical protein PENNAL_c0004G07410 [Penicillium nalgiovense]
MSPQDPTPLSVIPFKQNYCTHERNPNGRLTDPSHPRSKPQRHTTRLTSLNNAPRRQKSWMPNRQQAPNPTASSTWDLSPRIPVRGLHPMRTTIAAGLSDAF